jgi:predicted nucleotidyltransferase
VTFVLLGISDRKTFDNYMGVRRLLERLFQRKIDLVIKSGSALGCGRAS